MSASPLPSAANATLRGGFLAAIFLMATSAIGPGFITQTATFTAKLGAAFAFAILASILIDFVVQLNIWRITALTRKNASETANAAIPGAGYLLAVLVMIGGLAFNVGNIAGAGLGLNAMLGLDPKIGGALSALLVFVGGFNGLILPIGLTIFTYVGFARSDLMGGHRYNRPLLILSAIVCALTWYMGYRSIGPIFAFLNL